MKSFNLLSICAFFVGLNACAQVSETSMQEASNPNSTAKLELNEQEWRERLTETQYYVLRSKGTEAPFTGEFVLNKEQGTYKCAGCGEALFTDSMKFDSHCGWPSFDREIQGRKIIQTTDLSHGMRRTEITCARCGGHLGHLFDDGPTETGLRYCVNSAALTFEPKKPINTKKETDTITLAGGCFWCIEAIFEALDGVVQAESGYSGGNTHQPTYKSVSTGQTGHAEVVQLVYRPDVIALEELFEVFFSLHDPTTLNRQGADYGTQYRSAIFYHSEDQKNLANQIIAELNAKKAFNNPIVTEVTAFKAFYKAENYHQEYYALNREQPYCRAVIQPKMDKLHQVFANKLKEKQP